MQQTNEPSIEQMNEVIAKFMGLTPIPAGTKRLGDIKHPEISAVFLKYHSSWDWLMPGVSKLKICFKETIISQEATTDMVNGSINIQLMMVRIEGAHAAVYHAIQWYNKLTTNNESKP